jgi:glycosyltransferase involved in cell wall biosynthesis
MYKEKLEKSFNISIFHFWSNKYITKYTFNKKKYLVPIVLEYIANILKRLWQLYVTAPRCDIIFVQKGIIPGINRTFLTHLRKQKKRIVFDVDDAIYLKKGDNSDSIASQSSVIICGNEELASHYKEINSNCVILPTIEDTRKFRSYWSDTFDNKILGWIGSGVTLENLDLIVDAINSIVELHPEVQFHIISNDPGDYLERIRGSKFIKWQLDSYMSELSRFTVGLMPLKDIPINYGKCGFKLVQCLSMKKPVIATDLGVNSQIVGRAGMLADSREEWVEAFEELLFHKEAYDECVRNIEDSFLKEYNFDSIASRLIDIINDS